MFFVKITPGAVKMSHSVIFLLFLANSSERVSNYEVYGKIKYNIKYRYQFNKI